MSSIRGAPASLIAVALFVTACQATAPPSDRDVGPNTATVTVSTPKPYLAPRAAPAPTVARGTKIPDPQPSTEEILNRRLAALGIDAIHDAMGFVGRSAAEIDALMGTPDFARREDPAELWQYASTRCVLNLFLYSRGDGQQMIEHAELRSRDPSQPVAPESCLKEIILGRIVESG